jgi:hypothetical protein
MLFDSRRAFLKAAVGSAALVPLQSGGQNADFEAREGKGDPRLKSDILALFQTVTGAKSLKIWAPRTEERREFLVEYKPSDWLFVGSAIKAFILCERLRQLDSPNVADKLMQHQVKMDASVWSADSQCSIRRICSAQ